MKSDSHSYRFKHLYGDTQLQKIKWENLVPNVVVCDSCLIKGNEKYAAFSPKGGGGNLQLLRYDHSGKLGNAPPCIRGHKGSILDFDFYPYNPNYVATSSDDGTIKLWNIPEDIGQGMDITKEESTLAGHSKKVNLCSFNQASQGILASISFDHTVRVWDINSGKEAFCLDEPQDQKVDHPTSLEWNGEGNLIGTCWKDKTVRIADPRQKEYCATFHGHDGAKAQNIVYLSGTDYLVTTGFSGGAPQREYKLWSIKDFSKPVKSITIDKAAGIIKPFWDKQLEVMYLCGKGDGNIRYYEWNNGDFKSFANDYKSNVPGRGYGMLPKYCCDPMKQEIARFLKLEEKAVELIPFVCPKADKTKFHEDIYPDVEWGFGQSGEQWIAGNDAEAVLKTMKPGENEMKQYAAIKIQQAEIPVKKEESKENAAEDLKKANEEIAQLKKKIQELEAENEKLKSSGGGGGSEEIEKIKEENQVLKESNASILEKVKSVQSSTQKIAQSVQSTEQSNLDEKLNEIKVEVEEIQQVSEQLQSSSLDKSQN